MHSDTAEYRGRRRGSGTGHSRDDRVHEQAHGFSRSGGGHSIGVPLAVSADYSLIVPSATMVIHPVRQNGMFIGVAQSYRNMEKTQDRITEFVSSHSGISQKRLEELMLDTRTLVKDVGTLLDGREAVKEGLIDEVGGISRALEKLHELMGDAGEK